MKLNSGTVDSALCLASQLPENPDDALAVLDCVRELVGTFLRSEESEPAPKAKVLSLIRDCQELY
jgi:hypothetical protein